MGNSSDVSERDVEKVHKSAIIIDGLSPHGNLDDLRRSFIDFHEGGVTAANTTVAHVHGFEAAVKEVAHYKHIVRDNADKASVVTCVHQIEEAKNRDVLGIILGFQDTRPIEKELLYLDVFYDMDVRIIQLTYNSQNFVGTGACELSYGGLTYFGRQVVKALDSLGIVIDLSHCCDETTLDAIEYSRNPVICSHSNTYVLCNAYGRNKPDRIIKALADKGGVVGVVFQPCFVKMDPETYEVLPSSVEDVLNHIDYIVELVGIDHVGFGSDLCAMWLERDAPPPESSFRLWRPKRPDVFGKGPTETYDAPVEGLEAHSKLMNLTRGLLERGYSEQDVRKILGGNFLRVFGDIWKE